MRQRTARWFIKTPARFCLDTPTRLWLLPLPPPRTPATDTMTRWIVLLLLGICAAVALAEDFSPDDAACQAFAAKVKTEGQKRWDGPKHYFCGDTIGYNVAAYCNCAVVPRKRELNLEEFLNPVKANSFLSRGIAKRGLHEECCVEGCYWEEIEEEC